MPRGSAAGPQGLGADPWRRLEGTVAWQDLGLAAPLREQLEAVPVAFSQRFWSDSTAVTGASPARRGMMLLFSGADQAGKTAAAQALAGELRLAVLEVDVEALFARGRTEAVRLMARLFATAQRLGAVLLMANTDRVMAIASGGVPGMRVTGTAPIAPIDVRDLLRRGASHPGIVIFSSELAPRSLQAILQQFDMTLEFSGGTAPTSPQPSVPADVQPPSAAVPPPSAPPVPPAPVTAPVTAPPVPPVTPPVTATPRPAPAAATPEAVPVPAIPPAPRPAHRPVKRLIPVALLGALAAMVLGLTLAERHSSAPAVQLFDRTASAGNVTFSYPSGWQQISVPALPGLTLTQAIAFASAKPPAGQLVIGLNATSQGSPIPASFVQAEMPGNPATQVVKLGGKRFYRVLPRLALKLSSRSIYALPISGGTVVAVCGSSSQAFASLCERVLGTLSVKSRAVNGYSAKLAAILAKLNATRASSGKKLAGARDSAAQANAASSLAAAHSRAAASIKSLGAGAATKTNAALTAALLKVSAAYASLARAAAHNDRRAYGSAQQQVAAADKSLSVTVAAAAAGG